MKKRISLLLILAMLMSLLPISATVLAAESKLQLVGSLLDSGITTGSAVYFGQYTKDGNSKTPILWRVIGNDLLSDKQTVTLMSEYFLEYRQYDSYRHYNWSGSAICKYLNSEGDYTNTGFLTTAFTNVEQGYITAYSNVPERNYMGSSDSFTPNQKIVLPSVNEVEDGGSWGFNGNASRTVGVSGGNTSAWWLRSPGAYEYDVAAYVDFDGSVREIGIYSDQFLGVRPALKLDLESVPFTSVQRIEVPNAIRGVANGISEEVLKSKLPATIKVNNGPQEFKVEWHLSNYNRSKKEAHTYTFEGKVQPEGVFVLAGENDLSIFNTTILVTVDAAVYQSEYGLNAGGGSSSTAKSESAEQVISQLSQKDKETIIQNFKQHMPYTYLSKKLTVEHLKKLTGNKFTDKQIQEMLDKPELLKKLGIDESMLSTSIVLKAIKDASFTDVPKTHWASSSIKIAAELGLVAGMPDGSFDPNRPLQVADTLTFLDRVLLLHGITEMKLSRSTVEKYITQKDHWAFFSMASTGSKLSEETLKAVSELGDKPFSRELLAQVLYEITKGKLEPIREEIAFVDIADSPYKEAIDYCTRVGLLSGISSSHMAPNKALTRAELMSVLIRLNEKLR